MIRLGHETTCRSCEAPLWMLKTDKGKTMPVDPAPNPSGNLTIEYAAQMKPGDPMIPIRVHTAPDDWTGPRYVSHFVTCPNAAKHRRKR